MPQTLIFLFVTVCHCHRPSVSKNNVSLKYQRFTSSGCKDMGFRKLKFGEKVHFFCFVEFYILEIQHFFSSQNLFREKSYVKKMSTKHWIYFYLTWYINTLILIINIWKCLNRLGLIVSKKYLNFFSCSSSTNT